MINLSSEFQQLEGLIVNEIFLWVYSNESSLFVIQLKFFDEIINHVSQPSSFVYLKLMKKNLICFFYTILAFIAFFKINQYIVVQIIFSTFYLGLQLLQALSKFIGIRSTSRQHRNDEYQCFDNFVTHFNQQAQVQQIIIYLTESNQILQFAQFLCQKYLKLKQIEIIKIVLLVQNITWRNILTWPSQAAWHLINYPNDNQNQFIKTFNTIKKPSYGIQSQTTHAQAFRIMSKNNLWSLGLLFSLFSLNWWLCAFNLVIVLFISFSQPILIMDFECNPSDVSHPIPINLRISLAGLKNSFIHIYFHFYLIVLRYIYYFLEYFQKNTIFFVLFFILIESYYGFQTNDFFIQKAFAVYCQSKDQILTSLLLLRKYFISLNEIILAIEIKGQFFLKIMFFRNLQWLCLVPQQFIHMSEVFTIFFSIKQNLSDYVLKIKCKQLVKEYYKILANLHLEDHFALFSNYISLRKADLINYHTFFLRNQAFL